MKINVRLFSLAAVALTTIALSVLIVTWASEKFFFDRFYYYKSIKHGYWISRPRGKSLSPRDFGKRGYDIAALSDFIRNQSSNTLGSTTDDKMFTVAVIGDSYVWGQGLVEEDRFVNLLKEKLNLIRSTKMISLGNSGDSMLDNYLKYLSISKIHKIDLYIFGIVDNDLLLREKSIYNSKFQNTVIKSCDKPIILDPPNAQASEFKYGTAVAQSYEKSNFGNWCVFEKSIKDIAVTNSLFFNFGDHFGDKNLLEKYTNALMQKGHVVISPLFNNIVESGLHVSRKDPHPSAYANRVFANTLYESIIKLDYFRR